VHIITVEDPVEYKIQGITQVQVNPKAGLTFAGSLRAILRQDPDVIMVGEIRDSETAEIALQAAQTGHLVLSTLHTNDSVSVVSRLTDLGAQPFLICSSVTAVLAQRLLRRLCSCSKSGRVSGAHLKRLLAAGVTDFSEMVREPVGCPACDNTGYKGRVGVYELLLPDEAIRDAIRSGISEDHLRNIACSQGMKLMQEDALGKVRAGITTLDEVFRVLRFEDSNISHCADCGKPLNPSFLFCPLCGTRTRAAMVVVGS